MGMFGRLVVRGGWALLAMVAPVCPALAQIASGGDSILFRSDAAGVRIEPQYEPRPLNWGPLLADVRLTARSVVDSNVFRTTKSGADDIYLELAPSVRVFGRAGRANVTISANASIKRFSRFARENNETFELSSSLERDLGSDIRVRARTLYASETESRGVAGSNLVEAGPAELKVFQSGGGLSTDIGHVSLSIASDFVERSYAPLKLKAGGTLDQSFRDTRSVIVASRVSYGLTTAAAFFVAASSNLTVSTNRQSSPLRDSESSRFLAGFRTETDGLIVGEIGVGWRGQNYRNPVFRNYIGFTYDATVDWYPTRLVSARIQLGQDIVNSGLPTVAGILRRSAALNVYYDPLRNLRFSLALDREHDEFREIGFSTKTVTATLTGRYQVGRHLIVSAFGRIQSKDTSDSKRLEGYDSVAIGVALTGIF